MDPSNYVYNLIMMIIVVGWVNVGCAVDMSVETVIKNNYMISLLMSKYHKYSNKNIRTRCACQQCILQF